MAVISSLPDNEHTLFLSCFSGPSANASTDAAEVVSCVRSPRLTQQWSFRQEKPLHWHRYIHAGKPRWKRVAAWEVNTLLPTDKSLRRIDVIEKSPGRTNHYTHCTGHVDRQPIPANNAVSTLARGHVQLHCRRRRRDRRDQSVIAPGLSRSATLLLMKPLNTRPFGELWLRGVAPVAVRMPR